MKLIVALILSLPCLSGCTPEALYAMNAGINGFNRGYQQRLYRQQLAAEQEARRRSVIDDIRRRYQAGEIEFVPGYFRSDGVWVDGHFRTKANNTETDNWSTYPNINPVTGKSGKKQAKY